MTAADPAQPDVTLPGGDLPAAQDFYRLRREGIGHIQEAGRLRWTDYNSHDPGITVLEALAYAITELGYRSGFPIEDLLASAAVGATPADPYPDQAFYSARTILTVNPTTAEDLRRLLIDVGSVRNAWARCRTCGCETPVFARFEGSGPALSHDPPQRDDPATKVGRIEPRGLYDVLLELEADPELGDLNDGRVVRTRTVVDGEGRRRQIAIEVRFPSWGFARRDEREALAGDTKPFGLALTGPKLTGTGPTAITDDELRRHWLGVFYVDFDVTLGGGTKPISIPNAAVRVFGDATVRERATVADLLGWLGERTAEGFVEPYRRKLAATDNALAEARAVLHAHRNLGEDVCHVDLVGIDDIGVCADVEVEPSADIELVQAWIWFEIERYLDPPVDFWSLVELRRQGKPVEDIFNGPELGHGFLTAEGLRASDLRTELRVSDIIDRLSRIAGVVSVSNVRLTVYDAAGSPIRGRSDPTWPGGVRKLNPDTISAAWLLYPRPDHRPRLHRRLSRFLFSSRGLPFLPRLDEAGDALIQLHGKAARPRIRATEIDLPIPPGISRELESCFPVQHSLPQVYGIGPAGLPATASTARRAQARQLKAYLMIYEQLLRNAYAQVAHVGELFSLDPSVDRTYFSALLDPAAVAGLSEIVPSLDAPTLQGLVETETEFIERRNRFLDHLLARFGESFDEYALALADLEGQTRARADLIRHKLAFLRALPQISHDRARARDRTLAPCDSDNAPGLQRRVNLLLGLPDWTFTYHAQKSTTVPAGYRHWLSVEEFDKSIMSFPLIAEPATAPPSTAVAKALVALLTERGLDVVSGDWKIRSREGRILLTTGAAAEEPLGRTPKAMALSRALADWQRTRLAELMLAMLPERHRVVAAGPDFQVEVLDRDGTRIVLSEQHFENAQDAGRFVKLLAGWAAHKRAIVVEHLLLRPKFPGDALYPACADGCADVGGDGECGCDLDPYSFRLTYVMPGWTEPFSTNLAMRGYADLTIQEQTPSHLLGKSCWVGNDGFVPDRCDPMIDRIARILSDGATAAACACAAEIYEAFGAAFTTWLTAHPIINDPPDVLATVLTTAFAAIDLSGVSCAAAIDSAAWAELQALLVEHFVEIARSSHQFERFEDAWCAWAEADATIDWTSERLHDSVVELLGAGVVGAADNQALCDRAATILAAVGSQFHAWVEDKLGAGTPLDQPPAFAPAIPGNLSLPVDVAESIASLLEQRYARYTEVSYRLHILLRHLGELRNTYPRATLHDCDEGSDANPVRLGQTALGSN